MSTQSALERVREARIAADRGVASLRGDGSTAAGHLRRVHPVLLVGAAVVAGVLVARVISGQRGARRLAPLAALAGYVERHVLVTLAKSVREWWAARVLRESARSGASSAPGSATPESERASGSA